MNLTFEQFNDAMNYFIDKRYLENDLGQLLNKHGMTEFITPQLFTDLEAEHVIVQLLESMFNDAGQFISYYVYELDCGRKWEPGMITREDGVDICLKDNEHLWNFLMENLVDGEHS